MFETRKASLQEQIDDVGKQVEELKQQRESAPRRLPIGELPEDQRFLRLALERKHFLDTVKMICYRAETAMASLLRPMLARSDDARSLLRQIHTTEADLFPDHQALSPSSFTISPRKLMTRHPGALRRNSTSPRPCSRGLSSGWSTKSARCRFVGDQEF